MSNGDDKPKRSSSKTAILLAVGAVGAVGTCVCGGAALAAWMLTARSGSDIIGDPPPPPPPGNPKGSFFVADAGPALDSGPATIGPLLPPPPANPKGSLYVDDPTKAPAKRTPR